jgi:hypothetical protein
MSAVVAGSPPSLCVSRLVWAATQAPSPDNNQPWRFSYRDGELDVYHDARRALPSDAAGMFAGLAVGACIENVCIAARPMGCLPRVTYSPEAEAGFIDTHDLRVATIRFDPDGAEDPLEPYLESRCTNRRPFAVQPIPSSKLRSLEAGCDGFAGCRVVWVTARREIRRLARLVARADLVRFQSRSCHEELFRQLRFSSEEAVATRDGLDLRTLELPPAAARALGWLRPWRRMQSLHRLGLGRLLTWPSAQLVRKSGAIGVLMVQKPSFLDFVQGGRAFQRLWLTAHRESLWLHPLGSLPIFLRQLEQRAFERFPKGNRRVLETLQNKLYQVVPELNGGVLVMLFRVGQGSPPSARSLRRGTEDVCDFTDVRMRQD